MIRRCVVEFILVLLLMIVIEPSVGIGFWPTVNDEARMSNDETMTNDQMKRRSLLDCVVIRIRAYHSISSRLL
jgi:hypothetical protein